MLEEDNPDVIQTPELAKLILKQLYRLRELIPTFQSTASVGNHFRTYPMFGHVQETMVFFNDQIKLKSQLGTLIDGLSQIAQGSEVQKPSHARNKSLFSTISLFANPTKSLAEKIKAFESTSVEIDSDGTFQIEAITRILTAVVDVVEQHPELDELKPFLQEFKNKLDKLFDNLDAPGQKTEAHEVPSGP